MKCYLEKERPCIVCGSIMLNKWAKKKYLEAKQCKNCGMISVNPHFSDYGLEILYSEYFSKRQEKHLLKQQREKVYLIDRDWVCNFIKSGIVLDVGCSGGFFLNKFSPKKWDRFGVEIDPDAAEYAKKKFNIPVRVGNIVELRFGQQFDLIMLRGVIEHCSDPIAVLEKCRRLLVPGGYLFITATPAGDSFAFDVYREKWGLFTPLEHIHFFSVKLLSRVLNDYGMRLVSFHYQYEETPYANPPQDFSKIKKDIYLALEGQRDKIKESVPFPGSMITALWQKM